MLWKTLFFGSRPARGDYTPEAAGLLASLNSKATPCLQVASVSSISYPSHNGLSSETYGNGLVHATSAQGRFTSPDPLMASAKALNPQTWNRFSYVVNNPLKFVDPSGMILRSFQHPNTDKATFGITPALLRF